MITGVLNGTVTGSNYSTRGRDVQHREQWLVPTVDNGKLVTSVLSIPQGSSVYWSPRRRSTARPLWRGW